MAQFARPNSDVTIGSWTGSPTDTAGNRYQNIDETSASDSDYVRSPNDPASSAVTFGLSSVTDPVSATGHVVRYRYKETTSGGGSPPTTDLIVTLLQGTTTIASATHNDIAETYTDGSFTLTSGEANSITDYTALRIRFSANKSSGARTCWAEVSFAELEVPDVPAVTSTQTITGKSRISKSVTQTETGVSRISADTTQTITGVSRISATSTQTITGKANIDLPPTVALNTPADTGTVTTLTPTLNFTGTDANNDDIEYQIQIDTVNTFDSSGAAAIAYDASSYGGATTDVLSVPHTVANQSNRLLVVGVSTPFQSDIGSVKYNGASLTKINGSGDRCSLWYILNPDTGTHDIDVTYAFAPSTRAMKAGGISLYNVLQASPEAQTTGTNNTDPAETVIATTSSDNWVVSVISELFEVTGATSPGVMRFNDGGINFAGATLGPNSSGNVTASWAVSGAEDWYVCAAAFAAASGGSPLIDAVSETDAGFTAGHPFTSGVAKDYTVQGGDALTNGETYYWRVRAIDPTGSNTYGAWSSTRSFDVSTGTITPQTITGKSRISANATQTITGKSAIEKDTTQTITGVSSIVTTSTQTIDGVSRISADSTQTIDGVARISTDTTQTIDGKARISITTPQTISGVAAILNTANQTIDGVARISVDTTQTETGVSRISANSTQTIDGVSRISVTGTQTLAGTANISIATSQTIDGVSRISVDATQTIDGVSRIAAATNQTETGVARISADATQTITGVSNIVEDARYWVGGTGTWNGTAGTKWSLTSGGAGGASIPTSAQHAIFDANSGSGTVTISTGNTGCRSLICTGFTGTLGGSAALNIAGSLTLSAGMTRSFTSILTFSATSAGQTITLAGKTLSGSVIFNGVGGEWTLQDTFVTGGYISFNAGSFITGNNDVTADELRSASPATMSLTLGSSTINLQAGASSQVISFPAGFTIDAGTSTINIAGTNSSDSITIRGTVTLYNLVFTDNATSSTITRTLSADTLIINNLTYTMGASTGASRLFKCYGDITVNGTLTLTGQNSSTKRILFVADGNNTYSGDIYAAAVSLSNVDFCNIQATGTTWSGTSIGNGGNCSGITFTTPVTRYWVGDSGNYSDTAHWSASSGGAGGQSVPIAGDTVIVDDNSITTGSQTITQDCKVIGGSCDFSAVTTAFTWSPGISQSVYIFGNLSLSSVMTVGDISINFGGGGTNTLTTNGVSVYELDTFTMAGTLLFGDAVTIRGYYNHSTGTLDTNDMAVTTGAFYAYWYETGAIYLRSSTISLTGTGTAWDVETENLAPYILTLDTGTSTIKFTNTSNSTVAFYSYFESTDVYYNNIVFDRGASTGVCDIYSTLIGYDFYINSITDNGTAAHNLTFGPTADGNYHVGGFDVTGSAGNLITLTTYASYSTQTHTLIKTGVGIISCDYLDIQHSVATPANKWYAGANSVDNQATSTAGSGWIFTAPPPPVDQTITGKARITADTTQTETGVSRVTVTATQTETGVSRVANVVPQTETGISRISKAVAQTESGTARVSKNTARTVTGRAKVVVDGVGSQSLEGVARISVTESQTETGKARIALTSTQNTTGTAHIVIVSTQSVTGTSRISNTVSQTITGKAKIAASGRLKYWDGSAWTLKILNYWNGSAWVEKTLKRWDGSSWSS